LEYVDDFLRVVAFFPGDSLDIELGDLDNDGDLDALRGEYSGTFTYIMNNGDRT